MRLKSFILAGLLVTASANAGTITWDCVSQGAAEGLAGAAGSNTGTVTCTPDTPGVGGSASLVFSNGLGHYGLDFTFNPTGPDPKSATFDVDGLGNLDLAGVVVNTANRPVFTSGYFGGSQAPLVADGATLALLEAAARSGSSIVLPIGALSYAAGSTAVTAGTVALAYTVDFTDTSTPEPSTIALLSSALAGFALLQRRRK